jgi:hypothetical protein
VKPFYADCGASLLGQRAAADAAATASASGSWSLYPLEPFACRPRRTVFMERGRSKRSSRASGAQLCASVAQTSRACSQLWNSPDLRGRREGIHAIATCNRVARWRNLAAESVSSLATRASSHPSALQTPNAAQNQAAPLSFPKLWFIITTRASLPLLISSVAQIHPGNNRSLRHSSSAATHRQQPAPDAVLPRATECLAKPSTWASRALRQSSSAATRRPQLICASTQFFTTRASLSSAKPRK